MSEDPWDDWETAADAGLIDCNIPKPKAVPAKISTNTTTTKPASAAAAATTTNNTAEANLKLWEKANEYATPKIILANSNANALHTEYKPQLKILKRPDDAKNRKEAVAEKSIKPLADREKDYLEARRKIFEKYDEKRK